MRLFIGIRPNEAIRSTLVKAQEDLAHLGISGSFLLPGNLHMTLAFIGEHPDADSVLNAMDNAADSPFEIVLSSIGTFNNSILWAGIEKNETLEHLVRRLRYELAKADIPVDISKFVPHFTLVRKADLSNGVPSVNLPPFSMAVDQLSLYRSDRGKSGMIYTEIGTLEL